MVEYSNDKKTFSKNPIILSATAPSSLAPVNFTHTISVKLDNKNYDMETAG
jgi:hypothetical protein